MKRSLAIVVLFVVVSSEIVAGQQPEGVLSPSVGSIAVESDGSLGDMGDKSSVYAPQEEPPDSLLATEQEQVVEQLKTGATKSFDGSARASEKAGYQVQGAYNADGSARASETMKSEKVGYQAQGAYNADGSARASETMKSAKAGYQAQGAYNADGSARASETMKSEKAGYQAQGAYNADGSARASETMKSEKAGYQAQGAYNADGSALVESMKSEKAGYQAQGAYNTDGSARASETMKSEKAGYQFAEQEQKGLVAAQAAYDAMKGTGGAEAKIAGLQKRRAELDAEIQNLEAAEESCSWECKRAKDRQNSMDVQRGWTVLGEGCAQKDVEREGDMLCLQNTDSDGVTFYIACCDQAILATEAGCRDVAAYKDAKVAKDAALRLYFEKPDGAAPSSGIKCAAP